MSPHQYPEAARTYARLSPDIYCGKHLANYLSEHGNSLESHYNWLRFRLDTDSLPLTGITSIQDLSIYDNLLALG